MKHTPVIVYPDAEESELERFEPLFDRLGRIADFRAYCGRPGSFSAYHERIADANALLLGWDLPKQVMEQALRLEVISFAGTGVSRYVDLGQARKQNITICNCPAYSDTAVAEHAMALLLSVARRIPVLDNKMKAGNWDQSYGGIELKGRRAGILGFGGIARNFALLCNGFGMDVRVWTRHPDRKLEQAHSVTFCSLDELYQTSDVVSLHLALTSETKHMVDEQAFEKMVPGAVLINTARAELIVESALIRALETGRVSAAGLDVFHQEPLAKHHPLLSMGNVVLTPHIAFNTPQSTWRMFQTAVSNLESYFAGEAVNIVDGLPG